MHACLLVRMPPLNAPPDPPGGVFLAENQFNQRPSMTVVEGFDHHSTRRTPTHHPAGAHVGNQEPECSLSAVASVCPCNLTAI